MRQEKFDVMQERINQLMDEGDAACLKAEQVLQRVPWEDVIVGELHTLFMDAADEYEAAHRRLASLDELVATATKLRDASLAWSRYVEAAADLQSELPPMEAALRKLAAMGFAADSGKRRKDSDGIDRIVWVAAPGLPANVDTGNARLNTLLEYLRSVS